MKIVHDTQAPEGVAYYTTLVIFHGLGFHSGVFRRLLPFVRKNKCRLVFVNRPGYPDVAPHGDADIAQLRVAQGSTLEAQQAMTTFMRDRAYEFNSLLAKFIVDERPPPSSLVPVFWSLGGLWLTALLAYAHTFPVHPVDVAPYIRRVVAYDVPTRVLGFTPPQDLSNPLDDPDLAPADRISHFPVWVSGYYLHDVEGSFENHPRLANPPPTLEKIAPEVAPTISSLDAAAPDAADGLVFSALLLGGARALKNAALYPAEKTGWGQVEWRNVFCDHSAWEMQLGAAEIEKELKAAAAEGKQTRTVVTVRWNGANHFAHWDDPEHTLRGLLEDGRKDVDFLHKDVDFSFPQYFAQAHL
ncbi:hypothetical protein K488DRAFT_41586 [Vararia minispora EC-137]|uniref:Uncharacterized protein n=1 Tax=Vararia minispora EC-137 TaxID=1314806 RepID=A0ACB8QY74_9AGAM|nr:hypothetical protein K488DRAFT_41586 [Vararia minispora EC-137]